MIHDGLWCAFDDRHMGAGTDAINAELGIGREEQDAWAARSHARAHEAWEAGRLAEEVVAVEVPQRRGDPVRFDRDEGIRPGHDPRGARRPAAGVHRRRHRDRGQRLTDLRRRGGRRGHERAASRAARARADRRDRRLRHVGRSVPVAADRAGARAGEGAEEGGRRRLGPRGRRGQRGVRRGARCMRAACSASTRRS